jgi:hypothetical protein
VIARVLLQHLNSAIDAANLANEPTIQLEDVLDLVLRIHGSPPQLFLSCFVSEMNEVKNLAAVMRERSASVRVLHYIFKSLDITPIVRPIERFIRGLTVMTFRLLEGEVVKEKDKERLKQKLIYVVEKMLRIENIPEIICVLCYKCIELAEIHGQANKTDRCSTARWAVGALLFLRFVTPSVTSIALNQNSSSLEKKAAILFGRFLMKLCCGSKFENGADGILNEVLSHTTPYFLSLCSQVESVGSSQVNSILTNRADLESINEIAFADFYEFTAVHEEAIYDSISSKTAPLDEGSMLGVEKIYDNFKNELMETFVAKKDASDKRSSDTKESCTLVGHSEAIQFALNPQLDWTDQQDFIVAYEF